MLNPIRVGRRACICALTGLLGCVDPVPSHIPDPVAMPTLEMGIDRIDASPDAPRAAPPSTTPPSEDDVSVPDASPPDASPPDAALPKSGCADGQREGFVSPVDHPRIAGCSGGWSIPGVLVETAPSCGRSAGDDGGNPSGEGCNVADVCSEGWHVCRSAAEVAANGGCDGADAGDGVARFFSSRQSGPGNGECGDGANDIFGCGNLGVAPAASCAPLSFFSHDLCHTLGAPWSCGSDGYHEAENVVKASSDAGGVMCCED